MSGLRLKEYYDNPETKALTALCRRDILDARIKLARDRSLPPEAREELWQLDRRSRMVLANGVAGL